MKRSKVLFILHLPPPLHGAAVAGQYIRQSELIREEFDADFINLATNKILNQSGKGSFKKLFTFSAVIRQIINAFRNNDYDLCYMTLTSCGAGFYKDLVVVSIVKLFTNKIVYHFHNKGVSQQKDSFSDKLYRYVFKDTKSILLSPHLYPDIQKYVKEEDVYYVPCGIPVDNEAVTARSADIQTEKKPLQILFLSNMLQEKGCLITLDACSQLKSRGYLFECHFVGAWSDVTEHFFTAKIREKGLSDVVFAHGPKYGHDKRAFFKKADVFVFPTYYHYETFGLVNLEAMQNSLPVIATPEGGIPDVVVNGKTGFLVPQKDAAAVADKLVLFIKDAKLRIAMGAAGRNRFLDLYTLEKFEKNIVTVLNSCITHFNPEKKKLKKREAYNTLSKIPASK